MTPEEIHVLLGLFDVLLSLGILASFVMLFVRGYIVPLTVVERVIPAIVESVIDELETRGELTSRN